MKKLIFPLCSQNLLRIDEYTVPKFINPIYTVTFCLLMLLVISYHTQLSCTNLQIVNVWSFFRSSKLIGNITISGNCHVQIYKSHMHEHFCFCSLKRFWFKCFVETFWSCIHKCIGTYSKIYNQIVNYLTDNCFYADKNF